MTVSLLLLELSTMQSPYGIGSTRDIRIMRDHHDRIARLTVECIDEIHDTTRIALIEIARRLIGEEVLYIRDKSPSDRHSLLLTS
jgi:hypothetical protein